MRGQQHIWLQKLCPSNYFSLHWWHHCCRSKMCQSGPHHFQLRSHSKPPLREPESWMEHFAVPSNVRPARSPMSPVAGSRRSPLCCRTQRALARSLQARHPPRAFEKMAARNRVLKFPSSNDWFSARVQWPAPRPLRRFAALQCTAYPKALRSCQQGPTWDSGHELLELAATAWAKMATGSSTHANIMQTVPCYRLSIYNMCCTTPHSVNTSWLFFNTVLTIGTNLWIQHVWDVLAVGTNPWTQPFELRGHANLGKHCKYQKASQ